MPVVESYESELLSIMRMILSRNNNAMSRVDLAVKVYDVCKSNPDLHYDLQMLSKVLTSSKWLQKKTGDGWFYYDVTEDNVYLNEPHIQDRTRRERAREMNKAIQAGGTMKTLEAVLGTIGVVAPALAPVLGSLFGTLHGDVLVEIPKAQPGGVINPEPKPEPEPRKKTGVRKFYFDKD